jgi:hypothetical protein
MFSGAGHVICDEWGFHIIFEVENLIQPLVVKVRDLWNAWADPRSYGGSSDPIHCSADLRTFELQRLQFPVSNSFYSCNWLIFSFHDRHHWLAFIPKPHGAPRSHVVASQAPSWDEPILQKGRKHSVCTTILQQRPTASHLRVSPSIKSHD